MKRILALALIILSPLMTLAQSTVTASAPVKNFKLPVLNEQGVRTSLLRGNEARYVNASQIDLSGMQYMAFVENNANEVETTLLAPSATVNIVKNKIKVHGDEGVRLVRNDLDVTGERWTYDHDQRKITIGKNVRVVFRTGLKDILK